MGDWNDERKDKNMIDLMRSWEQTRARDEDRQPSWRSLVVSRGKMGQTRELLVHSA